MRRFILLFTILFASLGVSGQTTKFTYQGKLSDGAVPANGAYEMQFKVFDNATVGGGTQIGGLVQTVNATVVNGIFTVELDFGAATFLGEDRYLEISVRRNVGETFSTLSPRQQIASAPYAIRALNAGSASNTEKLGGVDANQFVLTTDTRMSDDRSPTAGSTNYIQNRTTQQSLSNFNISGEGQANIFDATTQYNLNGSRILSNAGQFNVFVGADTAANNTGGFNTFVGAAAGRDNTTGNQNTFVGRGAGAANTIGFGNSYYGRSAGLSSTEGYQNSMFGQEAGFLTTTGFYNAFFGALAGRSNTEGGYNSFFGASAGLSNTTGQSNAFFGLDAGRNNTTANNNAFFGTLAGRENTTGTANAFFGYEAGLFNETASNNAFFGTYAGRDTVTGAGNAFFGRSAGLENESGQNNSFFGNDAGRNSLGSSNTFVGKLAGDANTAGSNNTAIGAGADVATGSLTYATAIGSDAVVSTSNTVLLGRTNGSDRVRVHGLGAAGFTNLCRNGNFEISTCSSSLRYKTNIENYSNGLDVISRLRPITFDWKNGGLKDLGLGAEEVAEVDENLVIRNEKGEIEGVKYDRVGVVLVNAVKEQQAVIERQQKRLDEQQKQIDQLKTLVCGQNANAPVCKVN